MPFVLAAALIDFDRGVGRHGSHALERQWMKVCPNVAVKGCADMIKIQVEAASKEHCER
jgi:hypothetical protein